MRRIVCALFVLLRFGFAASHLSFRGHAKQRQADARSSGLPAFYHTSEQIRQLLQQLSVECKGARLNIISSNGVVDAVDILPQSAGGMHMHHPHHHGGDAMEQDADDLATSAKDFRPTIMLVFGEHPRELISVESGLDLAQTLCSGGQDSKAALERANYRLVVNANPESRAHVEAGDYCLRDNPNGVDLNRNFAKGWSSEIYGDPQAQPGSKPFSEMGSATIRDLLSDGDTSVYVSVHSGGEFMLFPYGHGNVATGEPTPDVERLTSVLKPLSDRYCNSCQVGSISQLLGYSAFGNDADYAFANGVPLSFTFEIFGSVSLPHGNSASTGSGTPSSDGQKVDEDAHCFKDFNPQGKEEYDDVLRRWTSAYLDLSLALSKTGGGS